MAKSVLEVDKGGGVVETLCWEGLGSLGSGGVDAVSGAVRMAVGGMVLSE